MTKYYLEWRTGDYDPIEFRSTYFSLNDGFELAPAAQVLLGNKERGA